MKSAERLFRAIPIELPPNDSSADLMSINDNNVVVGVLSRNSLRAFVWDGKKTTILSPNSIAKANAINNAGVIVGSIIKDDYHFDATQWKNGRAIPLLPKWDRAEAFAINERGTIGGYFVNQGGQICGFLLLRDGSFHPITPKLSRIYFTGLNRSDHASLTLSSASGSRLHRAALFGSEGLVEMPP